jgi:hypothetical protein
LKLLPALLLASAALGACARADPLVPEVGKSELGKAKIIEKLARFVFWPALPAAGPAFTLCVSHQHPLLDAVRSHYERTTITQLPVLIRTLRRGEPLSGCRAAFILPAGHDMAQLRVQANREHVLLIGEGNGIAGRGVHIGFFSDTNRLRLEVNRKALEASGLKASFRLLEVARIVE